MRFYTLPEGTRKAFGNYPYIMVPFHKWRRLLTFHQFKHAIMDCGIDIFAKETDYPKGFYKEYIQVARYLTKIFESRIWCVIPDFCDDINPGKIKNNVQRTLENIEKFHTINGVHWIYPLQARYLDLESFRYSCKETRKFNPSRVSIGTVCKTRNIEFIRKCCAMARRYFSNAWIHAFGPTLTALKSITNVVDSFDTSAWYTSGERGKRMCINQAQRIEYFQKYLKKVNEIIEANRSTPITHYMKS